MYRSPTTRSGLGRRNASRTWKRWFSSGVPYGMLGAAVSTSPIGWKIDQIAASVAPPRLNSSTRGRRPRTASGSVTGIQSPDIMPSRTLPQSWPSPRRYSSRSIIWAGTVLSTVTPCAVIRSAQCEGSLRRSGSGSTSVPPRPRTPKTSKTDRSKPRLDSPRATSPAPTPNLRQTSSRVFTAAR
ncbi:hypothetical protein SSPIM334S_04379 [Streptomyces spiroverticillatus]